MKKNREVEKTYSRMQAASKLRRIADAIEANASFRMQIGGERILVPADSEITFEHEREGRSEELEIQLRWKKN